MKMLRLENLIIFQFYNFTRNGEIEEIDRKMDWMREQTG